MKIWANCIVKNEENFVWFAINSVINYLDKIIIYDTGSKDNTVRIIEDIKANFPEKIEFKKVGEVSGFAYTKVRQAMLDQSKCDWLLILDGDEVWFEDSIKKLITEIKDNQEKNEAFIVPFYNAVGDIYHHQEESTGHYNLLGVKGHRTIKAIKRDILGLHWDLPYPHEGLFTQNKKLIQDDCNLKYINTPFLHTSLLERSSIKKIKKTKLEIGQKFPENFVYPEVLSKPHPEYINSPFKKLSGSDLILANILTPIKRIKRKIKK